MLYGPKDDLDIEEWLAQNGVKTKRMIWEQEFVESFKLRFEHVRRLFKTGKITREQLDRIEDRLYMKESNIYWGREPE